MCVCVCVCLFGGIIREIHMRARMIVKIADKFTCLAGARLAQRASFRVLSIDRSSDKNRTGLAGRLLSLLMMAQHHHADADGELVSARPACDDDEHDDDDDHDDES